MATTEHALLISLILAKITETYATATDSEEALERIVEALDEIRNRFSTSTDPKDIAFIGMVDDMKNKICLTFNQTPT